MEHILYTTLMSKNERLCQHHRYTCFVNSPIVNILDSLTGLWSAWQHLHMVCHKSTHILIKRLWNCLPSPLLQYQYDGLLLHPGFGDDAPLSTHLYAPVDRRRHHQNPIWKHWWVLSYLSVSHGTHMATRWCKLEDVFLPSGITLVALLVPIALGIYVKRRWPKIAKKILRVGRL